MLTIARTTEHPVLTTDLIIVRESSILLIQRRKPPFQDMWALPGGKLAAGETLEQCARRELHEETGLEAISLWFVGIFDDPHRDMRGRYVSIAYRAIVLDDSRVQAGDDAANAQWWPLDALPPLAFDHEQVIVAALLHVSRK